jgi:hypothetical protein
VIAARPSVTTAAPVEIGVDAETAACPSPEMVAAELAVLLPRVPVRLAGQNAAAAVVHVDDRGDVYDVFVGDARRTIHDPRRRCPERARVVAVFVALVLFPPALTAPDPPRAPPPADGGARRSARGDLVARRLHVAVEALGLLATAPAATQALTTGGGAARARLGTGRFGISLGCGGLAPYDAALTGRTARLTRVPLDVSGYVTATHHRLELGVEAGVAPTLVTARGQGFVHDASALGLEWGIRGAVFAGFWGLVRGLGLRLILEATAVPYPLELVSPRERLGTTPLLWLGVGLGVVARLRCFGVMHLFHGCGAEVAPGRSRRGTARRQRRVIAAIPLRRLVRRGHPMDPRSRRP